MRNDMRWDRYTLEKYKMRWGYVSQAVIIPAGIDDLLIMRTCTRQAKI